MKKLYLAIFIAVAATSPDAHAGLIARIGDADGFGYGAAVGFLAANGGPANARGDKYLGNGDFLPDINRDGRVATGHGDDFDLRSAAERNNTANTFAAGVTNTAGTSGSKYTDISLSKSYDASSAAGRVLIGGNPDTGLIFGKGGAFPHPPSTSLPIQPGFVFSFDINKADLSSQTKIYFNLVFGDYDVSPAVIRLTKADGSTEMVDLDIQPKTEDGLIQSATATLNFGDIFKNGGSTWDASLKVDFLAPNEPYTAFDFVELSTVPLVSVPEPGSIVLTALGLASVVAFAIRRGRAGPSVAMP